MAKCEILVGYNTPQKKPILCDLQAIGKTIENGQYGQPQYVCYDHFVLTMIVGWHPIANLEGSLDALREELEDE